VRGKEIRERNNEELKSLLLEKREEVFRARLKNATHQLDDTSSMRKSRRDIARVLTVLKERSLENVAAQGSEE
jgi:large subunit ribosomal protein L29